MRSLEYTFKLLWGKPFQGERSKVSECKLKWRKMMAQRPPEERYATTDEEYMKLELENHHKCTELFKKGQK